MGMSRRAPFLCRLLAVDIRLCLQTLRTLPRPGRPAQYVAHVAGFDLEASCLTELVETMNADVVRAAPKA
jgi:hypothetical protein